MRNIGQLDESLNQPSSVQDDGPLGCKLLLVGNKKRTCPLLYVPSEKGPAKFRASSRGNTEGPGVIRIYWV